MESKRGIMNTAGLLCSVSEWERCYNRCGQTLSERSQRLIQPVISCMNTFVPTTTTTSPIRPPLLTFLYSLLLYLAFTPATTPPVSLCQVCAVWHHRTSIFFFYLVFFPPVLCFLFSLPLPLSLQQSLTQLYISSAVIDIFHLPASFPVGCQPPSPRQLR